MLKIGSTLDTKTKTYKGYQIKEVEKVASVGEDNAGRIIYAVNCEYFIKIGNRWSPTSPVMFGHPTTLNDVKYLIDLRVKREKENLPYYR